MRVCRPSGNPCDPLNLNEIVWIYNCIIFSWKAHLHQNLSSGQWPPEEIPNGNCWYRLYLRNKIKLSSFRILLRYPPGRSRRWNMGKIGSSVGRGKPQGSTIQMPYCPGQVRFQSGQLKYLVLGTTQKNIFYKYVYKMDGQVSYKSGPVNF